MLFRINDIECLSDKILVRDFQANPNALLGNIRSRAQLAPPASSDAFPSEAIRVMQKRFGSHAPEALHGMEHGISIGGGGVWPTLNEEQYWKLPWVQKVVLSGLAVIRPELQIWLGECIGDLALIDAL